MNSFLFIILAIFHSLVKTFKFLNINNTVLNGVAEHRMSLIFMPFDIDKNVDVWV